MHEDMTSPPHRPSCVHESGQNVPAIDKSLGMTNFQNPVRKERGNYVINICRFCEAAAQFLLVNRVKKTQILCRQISGMTD